jgi:hypothetical protein
LLILPTLFAESGFCRAGTRLVAGHARERCVVRRSGSHEPVVNEPTPDRPRDRPGDDKRPPARDRDDTPDTPPTEPLPVPVQEPPAPEEDGPYVVRR